MKKANQRSRGLGYERKVAHQLREMGFEFVGSTRQWSKALDSMKVDVYQYKIPPTGKKLEFYIQCKNSKSNIKYEKILSKEILENLDLPLAIIHKKTKKVNSNFIEIGEFVIMERNQFEKLIQLKNQ